jgi:hypothetical protein
MYRVFEEHPINAFEVRGKRLSDVWSSRCNAEMKGFIVSPVKYDERDSSPYSFTVVFADENVTVHAEKKPADVLELTPLSIEFEIERELKALEECLP